MTVPPRPTAVWHTLSGEDCLIRVQSRETGLTAAEAAARLEAWGPNELQGASRVTAGKILAQQFRNVLIWILLVAVVLSGMLGHTLEAVAIGVIVLFAALLGFIQEYRAERSMEALREMAAPSASVVRGGRVERLPTRELVVGDVIQLRAGDRVPADARILEAMNLRAEEAALTGESVPVEKQAAACADEVAPLGDRRCLAFAGTSIAHGRGLAVIVATGMETEFGQVARMLQSVASGQTPLQENLDKVGQALTKAALVIVALIIVLGLIRGEELVDMVIFGIALAVAVVPEALPAVVTISLAIGVQRMVRRNALIRRLTAVETLGSTTLICSDKTGTLTKDEMTVRQIDAGDGAVEVTGAGYDPVGQFQRAGEVVPPSEPLRRLLEAAVLASDAVLVPAEGEGSWQIQGDPTEGALVVAASKAGLEKGDLDRCFPRIHEIPFTSETKRMTTVHETPAGLLAYSKGAPEVLLPHCARWQTATGDRPLETADRERVLLAARKMAEQALRVLAVASHRPDSLEAAEQNMTFLGLFGMLDPPRPEARQAIATCRDAGINVVMITGDHPLTARAVASELGILRGEDVVTGVELDGLTDQQWRDLSARTRVYARVSPAHKLRIVSALQDQGHIVAMTGDGVNDAPALKKAAIGIAMGITGTDVTKEAAAMTLTDDNFSSIVAAIEEGRAIFGNIKKYLMYLLSANIGEIGLMAGAAVLGQPIPLRAVQLLYVNLATDGLPALALAVDPPDSDLMRRPPRDPRRGIFTRPVVALMLAGGLWSMVVNLIVFLVALRLGRSLETARSMTFVSLVLIEFLKAYCYRSDRNSVIHQPLANRWLDLAILWELGLLLLIVYVPGLQHLFQTVPLGFRDWLLVGSLAASIVPALEVAKWLVRRGVFGPLD